MEFDNTYNKLPDRFYKETTAERFPKPQLLAYNENLSRELGLNLSSESDTDLAHYFSGQNLFEGSEPLALPYAGHQFGHFVPQLGDGRAMLLGEIVHPNNKRFDVQLKGSGQTFFSRNGDGKSAMGPVIREYILSEAMYHLGVPTTRALAAVSTGEIVYREESAPGAVFTRIASSHIRIGTFQYFAAKNDIEGLKTLLDYSIHRHYPEIETNHAISFLNKVIEAQVSLVSKWMSIGFIHGVMNTDNMSISGETIDYGPCAFMDQFNSNQVYSFIDRNGRYAYNNQRPILHWNLSRLAECLIPLVSSDEKEAIELLNNELASFDALFQNEWIKRMKIKLGLVSNQTENKDENKDEQLIKLWLGYLEKENLDFTLSFRKLADIVDDNESLSLSFFKQTSEFDTFKESWGNRLKDQNLDPAHVKEKMNEVNPVYIPRNHQVERAIQQAITGDISIFNEMNRVLENPYIHQPELDSYGVPPLPEEVVENTFCGT